MPSPICNGFIVKSLLTRTPWWTVSGHWTPKTMGYWRSCEVTVVWIRIFNLEIDSHVLDLRFSFAWSSLTLLVLLLQIFEASLFYVLFSILVSKSGISWSLTRSAISWLDFVAMLLTVVIWTGKPRTLFGPSWLSRFPKTTSSSPWMYFESAMDIWCYLTWDCQGFEKRSVSFSLFMKLSCICLLHYGSSDWTILDSAEDRSSLADIGGSQSAQACLYNGKWLFRQDNSFTSVWDSTFKYLDTWRKINSDWIHVMSEGPPVVGTAINHSKLAFDWHYSDVTSPNYVLMSIYSAVSAVSYLSIKEVTVATACGSERLLTGNAFIDCGFDS
jgi:hypothetical protein